MKFSTLIFILLAVSCSFNHPIEIVSTPPQNCAKKEDIQTHAFYGENSEIYKNTLKKATIKQNANFIVCCTSFALENPDMEESVIALNPRTGKSGHVYGVRAQTYLCINE